MKSCIHFLSLERVGHRPDEGLHESEHLQFRVAFRGRAFGPAG